MGDERLLVVRQKQGGVLFLELLSARKNVASIHHCTLTQAIDRRRS